jgi:hypothetical protein
LAQLCFEQPLVEMLSVFDMFQEDIAAKKFGG